MSYGVNNHRFNRHEFYITQNSHASICPNFFCTCYNFIWNQHNLLHNTYNHTRMRSSTLDNPSVRWCRNWTRKLVFFIHLFPTFLASVLGQFALKRVHRFLQSLCIQRYTPNKVHGLFFTYWVNKFQLVILHFNKKKTFKLNKKFEPKIG